MTWVYCDPKSRMTICSFMVLKNGLCASRARKREAKNGKIFEGEERHWHASLVSTPVVAGYNRKESHENIARRLLSLCVDVCWRWRGGGKSGGVFIQTGWMVFVGRGAKGR